MEELGGPAVGGFGFAAGLDRLVLSLPAAEAAGAGPDVFIACLGESAWERGMVMVRDLRRRGLWVEWEPTPGRSLKAQSRRADRLGARYLAFLGDDELRKGTLTLKVLAGGEQREIPAADLDALAKELAR